MASKKAEIARTALPLFISGFLLHAFGFGAGYLFALASGCRESLRRTISIEVGMQNSGLGAALATHHFSQFALAPVPAAISAVYHCLIGSLLGGDPTRRPLKNKIHFELNYWAFCETLILDEPCRTASS